MLLCCCAVGRFCEAVALVQGDYPMETMTETPATTATVAAQPRATRRRRLVVGGLVGLIVLLGAVYLGVSAYTVNRISQPTRQAVGSCTSYGLTCQDVSFAS